MLYSKRLVADKSLDAEIGRVRNKMQNFSNYHRRAWRAPFEPTYVTEIAPSGHCGEKHHPRQHTFTARPGMAFFNLTLINYIQRTLYQQENSPT